MWLPPHGVGGDYTEPRLLAEMERVMETDNEQGDEPEAAPVPTAPVDAPPVESTCANVVRPAWQPVVILGFVPAHVPGPYPATTPPASP